jgi:hypothetical protein
MALSLEGGGDQGNWSTGQDLKPEAPPVMFGLLDLLATVATQTLYSDESLKDVTTKPLADSKSEARFKF